MQGLLAGPRADLVGIYGTEDAAEQAVIDAINGPSPRVRHGVDLLDPITLVLAGASLPVDLDAPGWVRWAYRPTSPQASATTRTEVRRSAQLTLADNVDDGTILSYLFRLWDEIDHPDGTPIRFHQGVFTSTLPPIDDDGRVVRRRLTLAPREHLWNTRTIADWQVIDADDDVIDLVKDDLASVFGITATAFPIPSGETTLGEDMVVEPGTSYLTKWTRMLFGIGLDQPVTNAEGLPTAQDLAALAGKGPEWRYAPGDGRVVVAGSTEPLDPELPNVVRVIARRAPTLPEEGNGWVTYRNQSTGPASVDRRGYEVFREVTADASNQEELEAFGFAEAQRLFAGGGLRWAGEVGLNPLHDNRDVIELVRPRLGLSGVWLPTSWTYPRSRVNSREGAVMSMTAEYRVSVT